MSKTTEQRIEEIIVDVNECRVDHKTLKLELENLVLSAKLDQLKESK